MSPFLITETRILAENSGFSRSSRFSAPFVFTNWECGSNPLNVPDTFANAIPNLNQFYMARLMTAPMVVIELAPMNVMYQSRKANFLIIALSITLGLLFFTLMRRQTGISDKQFLNSMIPHHASALLMCEQASINDAEIARLCDDILSSQQSQIDQMKAILNRLEK